MDLQKQGPAFEKLCRHMVCHTRCMYIKMQDTALAQGVAQTPKAG